MFYPPRRLNKESYDWGSFHKDENTLTTKLHFGMKKKLELVKCYSRIVALYGAETWTLSKKVTEIPGEFLNAVLEKNIEN